MPFDGYLVPTNSHYQPLVVHTIFWLLGMLINFFFAFFRMLIIDIHWSYPRSWLRCLECCLANDAKYCFLSFQGLISTAESKWRHKGIEIARQSHKLWFQHVPPNRKNNNFKGQRLLFSCLDGSRTQNPLQRGRLCSFCSQKLFRPTYKDRFLYSRWSLLVGQLGLSGSSVFNRCGRLRMLVS